MAIKGKSTGRTATDNKGIFDSRLSAGHATGLTRGTAKVGAGGTTDITVNKRKYVTKQYSDTYH